MGRIIACKSSELGSGQMKKVAVDGREILVTNVNGNYFACDDTCTHAGASLCQKVMLKILQLHVVGMQHNSIVKQEKWRSFLQKLMI